MSINNPKIDFQGSSFQNPFDNTSPSPQTTEAIIKIQAIWRGHLARAAAEKVKQNTLHYSFVDKAKPMIRDIHNSINTIPRAGSCHTPVYLPPELPIVLKQSGKDTYFRVDLMNKARNLCTKNNYQHLVIPKARICGDFIIENRLPLASLDAKNQMGLYMENREQFTAVAKEFTGFLCQSTLEDITVDWARAKGYEKLASSTLGRYDNAPLYLENGQGKIGLIDLERFNPDRPSEISLACEKAICFFPNHLKEIIEVAKTFDKNIESEEQLDGLEYLQKKTLESFHALYTNHVTFLKKNLITPENPTQTVQLDPSQESATVKALLEDLKDRNLTSFYYSNCLGTNPEQTLKDLQPLLPNILQLTTKALSKQFKGPPSITSYPELVSGRTLVFSAIEAKEIWYQNLLEEIISQLQTVITSLQDDSAKKRIASFIVTNIFERLAKDGGLALYDPNVGYVPGIGSGCCCIFF